MKRRPTTNKSTMNPTPKTWFTADLHFGHAKCLEYDNAPYASIEEHDEDIVTKWNATVAPNDIVWLLGDIAITQSKEKIRPFVERLKNGRKMLVLGNHDRRHGSAENMKFYYDLGFERVYDRPVILKNFFILSHEPVFICPQMPFFNIYGHIHNHPAFATETEQTMCVCCCRHNYAPVQCKAFDNFVASEHEPPLPF